MARKIEKLFIDGPAGRLEALLEEPEDGDPLGAALVCHPHPQHGGTMHTRVVHRTARALRAAGAVVLRFNYRGVHLSQGVFDRGIGEIEDARACLEWLRANYPGLPFMMAGFSFGSRIALKLAIDYPTATKVLAIGYPTKYPDHSYISNIRIPKIFLHSTIDEHGPKPDLEALVASLPEPKQLVFVESQDHFFADALELFEEQVGRIGVL